MMQYGRWRTWAWLLTVALLTGCGKKDDKEVPETAPVSGTVTYNGNAVEGATVTLQPAAGSTDLKPATGTTDASGNFTVQTFVSGADFAAGAMPGDYAVTVTKQSGTTMTPEQMLEAGQPGATPDEPASELPEKYSDPSTSGLTATVGPGGVSDLKLELTD